MDVGVLGGTFDPVHLGHLAIAEEARQRLSLSQVIFIPARHPWLKTGREITPVHHRIAMVNIAINDAPYFEVSTIEVDRPGPSYTAVTLSDLKKKLGKSVNLFVILGWDSLNELPIWHNPNAVVKMCKLVAFTRKDKERPDLDILEKSVPGIKKKTLLIDMKPVDVSSSEIRERVAKGLSLARLVPEKVVRYIEEQNLYR
jgi:nicotinate-nucleotide adenylyltransferase